MVELLKPRAHGRARNSSARCASAVGLVAWLLLSQPPPAFAADTATASGQPALDLAKAKYEQGVDAYRAERYADAARLFLEADAISPSAALSYNIARAYEKLGDDSQTLRWYRNYLRLEPAANNAGQVQQFVRSLSESLAKKGIQQLTVLSTPTGATVAIDGNALGVTPLTIELQPGEHRALLTLRGYSDVSAPFTLSASSALDLPVQLPPAALAATQRSDRRFGIAPYLTLGVGAALLGAAALFEVGRRSAQNAAKDDTVQLDYQRDFDAMNSRQTTARVLLGVGGAVVLTGAALLVLNTRPTTESHASIAALPGGGLLFVGHRF